MAGMARAATSVRAKRSPGRQALRRRHAPRDGPFQSGALPGGSVTFVLTDVEGSTRLWEQTPHAMRAALAQHDRLIETLITRHGGMVVRPRGEGDSRFAVFARASDAVAAACAIQRALGAEQWPTAQPLRVRMALHIGDAELRAGDYYGAAVNRCARLRGIAHGGQTLLSNLVAEVVRDALPPAASLRDLGQHRLKDLGAEEHIWQLDHPDLDSDFPPLVSLNARRNNLGTQLSSFVGREREQAEMASLLEQTRLLTLVGTGGVGKTRLALHTAAEVLTWYSAGAWLVELAPLTDPRLIPLALAATLHVQERPGATTLETLIDHLRALSVLIVLDNCEHLVQACAEFAERLLHECPRLTILATSREPLGISGETIWSVRPLGLPTAKDVTTAEDLAEAEASRLFLERARAAVPQFAFTPENARAIARICRQLDGIPLAIELAAARIRVLSASQIADRLDDCLRLLSAGGRTVLARQQTLRATLDWSHALLTYAEQVLFRRLAVFAGGLGLDAVEMVCQDDTLDSVEALDLLGRLVDKSLVVARTATDGAARYHLLEPVRQYAHGRLIDSMEADPLRRRHAECFLDLAERGDAELGGPHVATWLERLATEHDNLRAALSWLDAQNERDMALRLAAALWRFWQVHGHLTEGRAWLERLVEAGGEMTPARARALVGAGALAWRQHDTRMAILRLRQAVQACTAVDERAGLATALKHLGLVAMYAQPPDFGEAVRLLEESLAIRRALHDDDGAASCLNDLAVMALHRGELPRAAGLLEQSLELCRALGNDYGLSFVLNSLSAVALDLREYERTAALLDESVRVGVRLNSREGVGCALTRLASLAAVTGRPTRAARLFGAAEKLREVIGAPLSNAEREMYDRYLAPARAQLDPADWATLQAQGEQMSMEVAITFALDDVE
jgi:predicted ATPase/class 3 adenylate cyclase